MIRAGDKSYGEQKMNTEKTYEVGLFRREDAEGIVNLFKEVYGDEYPIRLFYDTDAITEANAKGDYYSITARTPEGKVIGVNHLFRSTPNDSLYEWGVGLVSREFRGEGVFNRTGVEITERLIPRLGMDAVFGEAVCNHLHSQKMVARAKFTDMALEVALMPAQTYTKEENSSGRVAALLQFRTYKPGPRKIFFPACYEEELRFLYSEFDDEREPAPSEEGIPADAETEASMKIFDFAGVARVTVPRAAAGFGERVDELERDAVAESVVVMEVWLKLTDPWVGAAVDILRKRGYFLGGALPRWFGGDGILMMKLYCEPGFDEIQLHSDRARRILEFVRSDWERASKQR
jgi:hypothetical protein